ncbi:MAG: CRTAC1 family protein, partial [Myxococcales bacterium]|nr:CRTAC1 family protein [Myxococcales bacterium]
LLLRVAGEVAGLDLQSARLQVADLGSAASEIQRRALQHHARPEPEKPRGRIVSATTEPSEAPASAFFSDVSEASGVDFRHRSSRWLGEFRQKTLKTPPTFSGGGVAAEDVEGDGDVDLLFAGGGGNALFLNDGNGHFRDATREAGLLHVRADGSPGEARNPIIADFDNDGLPDILISYANDDHQLFRNLGGARFRDVSSRSGLGGAGLVGGPVTVFDFDGDALLDIYVGYFGNYLEGGIPTFDRDNRNALPNKLFRNRGGLRFADVSKGSGTSDTGWCQAVSHVDFDRDGRQDLVVANDYGRNALLRNLGNGKFENVAPELGVTDAFHSMNVGVADLNDDDHPDLYISNLATLVKDGKYIFPDVDTPLDFDLRSMAGMLIKESDRLYLSQQKEGKLVGYLPSEDVERGESSTGWAWDAEFLDFDHDGDDDLYLVNGTNDFNTFTMVYRRFGKEGEEDAEYLFDHRRESNVFFRNEGGALRNVSSASGADFAGNSRSTAYLDFEGDGDLDIAVNNFHAKATLLRNDADKAANHWIKLRLVGDPERGSNRDAIGARIVATTPDGRRLRREVQGGSGYLSMNPKQQHLGLGAAQSVDVRVIWPSGAEQRFEGLAADRAHTLREGTGVVATGSRGYAADPIP